jgi:Flp pilus assembly protein TadD
MSRRIRALVALVLVSFALSTAACANTTGPQEAVKGCDTNGSNTCKLTKLP